MNIRSDIPLAPYTTFMIGGPADFFCVVSSEEELVAMIRRAHDGKLPVFILGKGSNILVADEGFRGIVIKNEIRGMEFGSEDNGVVCVTVGAGETWDDLVAETVRRNLHGIENLAAIPGTVGAAPVQNIGAYGVEIASTLVSVRVLDTTTLACVEFSNKECQFAYRDSRFKHEKGRYVIVQVTLRLVKGGKTDIGYKDLKDFFTGKNESPGIKEVRDAVIGIRGNKLPDWKRIGTAGSFFKNPIISKNQFEKLSAQYPGLPGYPTKDTQLIKVPLGWILDNICEAKGLRMGPVGTYEKQALVIVAQPGSSAAAVINFQNELIRRVKERTGIQVEREVEWVG